MAVGADLGVPSEITDNSVDSMPAGDGAAPAAIAREDERQTSPRSEASCSASGGESVPSVEGGSDVQELGTDSSPAAGEATKKQNASPSLPRSHLSTGLNKFRPVPRTAPSSGARPLHVKTGCVSQEARLQTMQKLLALAGTGADKPQEKAAGDEEEEDEVGSKVCGGDKGKEGLQKRDYTSQRSKASASSADMLPQAEGAKPMKRVTVQDPKGDSSPFRPKTLDSLPMWLQGA